MGLCKKHGVNLRGARLVRPIRQAIFNYLLVVKRTEIELEYHEKIAGLERDINNLKNF
jgi:hypothetical protein